MKNEKKHILEELEKLNAKKLVQIKASQRDTPEYFFEEMQNAVLNKVVSKNQKTKGNSFRLIPFAIAASLILLISISLFNKPKNEINFWAEVTTTDLESYVLENLEDFSDEEILTEITNSNIAILSTSNISTEDLSEYLLDADFEEDEFYTF